MLVKIQRNQIHHSKWDILDNEGNPTGEKKDVLVLNVQFPDISSTYTCGIVVDFPVTKAKLKAAILEKGQEAEAKFTKDEAIRAKFEEALGIPTGNTYEFDI